MGSYRYAIANTYDKQVNSRGQFRNEYLDDTGWWGLAWVAAYDLTGDSRYLNTARADADHMYAYWDSPLRRRRLVEDRRGVQERHRQQPLHPAQRRAAAARIAGDTVYRGRAPAGWTWFQSTGCSTAATWSTTGST